MTVSLSKITALEAALEYLIKATAGEKLEYLSPGEKAPGDTKIHTTPRGAKGYYPSEVARGEEDAEVPPELAPGEEQEVEVVQALEATPKLSSEYPKRVFDPDTEQYLRVVVPDNPDVHGVEPGIHRLSQPHGPPVRGTPISIYDPRIPDNVYHMTTNAPAVRASRKLIAGGVGGLGGDDRDQIVSLTINKEIAYQLAEDTKLASEVGRMGGGEYKSPERIKASKAIIKRLIQEMEKEGWDTPTRFREYADDHFEYMHESYNAKEWLAQYFTVRASATAKLGKEKLNPLFFTEPETLAKINPENVDVIEIPKSALRTGAMITDLDLDNPYGLQEIRIYGDVGVPEAKTSPYEMPQYNPSLEAYSQQYPDDVTVHNLTEANFEHYERMGMQPDSKIAVISKNIGATLFFGKTKEEAVEKLLTRQINKGVFLPPRLTPKPDWATNASDPFPNIPPDIKEIHYDDIPDFIMLMFSDQLP